MAMPIAYHAKSVGACIFHGGKLFLRVETEMLRAMVNIGKRTILGNEDSPLLLFSQCIATTLYGCITPGLREYGVVCLLSDIDGVAAFCPAVKDPCLSLCDIFPEGKNDITFCTHNKE